MAGWVWCDASHYTYLHARVVDRRTDGTRNHSHHYHRTHILNNRMHRRVSDGAGESGAGRYGVKGVVAAAEYKKIYQVSALVRFCSVLGFGLGAGGLCGLLLWGDVRCLCDATMTADPFPPPSIRPSKQNEHNNNQT